MTIKQLKLAISFYTRLPINLPDADYAQLAQAVIYLPVIGWIVGAISALSFYLAIQLWSVSTAIIFALIAGVLLTGGLHEDGFADVCDGFGGGYNKSRILAIMKDSSLGVYGVLGLVLLISLKISLLTNMPIKSIPYLLLAGHSISRFAPLLLMYRYDYAQTETSKVANAIYRPTIKNLIISASLACLPLFLLPAVCSLTLIFLLLLNQQLGYYFYRHIGGYTGDCLGASQQIAEILFYLSVSSLWIFI